MLGLIAGSVVSGLFGASSAKKAAEAQTQAAEAQIAEQRRQYDQSRADLAPYRTAGYSALDAQLSMLGLGGGNSLAAAQQITTNNGSDAVYQEGGWDQEGGENGQPPTGWTPQMLSAATPETYSIDGQTFNTMDEAQAYQNSLGGSGGGYDWQAAPGYQFRLDEGNKALERAAAARGMSLSSSTMKDFMRFGQGTASDEFWNGYNALSGIAGTGQNAVNTGISAGQTATAGITNALGNIGNAKASGYAGMNDAFQGTMGNMFSIYSMNKAGAFGSPSSGQNSLSLGGMW